MGQLPTPPWLSGVYRPRFACCAKHFCFDEVAEKGGAHGATEKHTDHKEKKKKKHHHKKHHHHDADPKLDP